MNSIGKYHVRPTYTCLSAAIGALACMAILLNLNLLDMDVLLSHYVTAQNGGVFILMYALITRSRLLSHNDCDSGALRNEKKGLLRKILSRYICRTRYRSTAPER